MIARNHRTYSLQKLALFPLFCLACLACGTTLATDYVWNGNATGNWNDTAQWTPTGFPNGTTDTATFNSTVATTVTLNVSVTVNSITFNNTNTVAINPSTTQSLTVQSALNLNSSTATALVTISSAVVLGAPVTVTVATVTNPTLTLSGVVSGSGQSLSKAGAGTLLLSGAASNTYSGGTMVSAGTLKLNKTAGIDAVPAGTMTVTGGTLLLNAANQINDAAIVNLSGSALFDFATKAETIASLSITGSSLINNTGTTITVTGTLANTSASTGGSGAALVVNGGGVFTVGGLATLGSGSTTLVSGGTNSVLAFNGGLVLNSATIKQNLAIPGGTIKLFGDLTVTGASSFAFGASTGAATLDLGTATRNFNITGSLNISPNVIGTGGGINKTGSGSVVMSNNNIYTGPTSFSGSTLSLTGSLPNTSALTLINCAMTNDLSTNAAATAASAGTSATVTNTISGTAPLTLSGGSLFIKGRANSTATSLAGCTWAITSTLITCTSTAGLAPGQSVSSVTAGLPAGAFVVNVASGTTFSINANTTAANATATTITAVPITFTVSQTFAGLTVNSGASFLDMNPTPGNGITLDLRGTGTAGITRSAGGTIDFRASTGGPLNTTTADIKTHQANDASGLLGVWATVNSGAGFAANDGSDNIAVYTGYTGIATAGSTVPNNSAANVQINSLGSGANIALAAATTNINSLTQSFNAASIVDTASKILQLGPVGVVGVNSGVSNVVTIGTVANSGTLTAGGTVANQAGEIYIENNGSNNLFVNAVIKDNGTGVVKVSSTGTGNYVPQAQSTYSGGTVLSAGTAIPITSSTGTAGSPTNGPFGTGPLTMAGAAIRASTSPTNVTIGNNTTFSADTGFASSGSNADKDLIFSGALTLANGTRTFTVNTSPATNNTGIFFNGSIGDGGSGFGVTKAGSGTLVIAGANTYSGPTTISNGTLRVTNSAGLGTSALSLSSGATGVLNLQGGVTLSNNIRVDGSGLNTNGAIVSATGANVLSNFGFSGSAGTRLNVATGSSLEITNSFAGSVEAGVRLLGSGMLILDADNSANVTTAFTLGLSGTAYAPIVAAGNDKAFGGGSIILDGNSSATIQSKDGTARTFANSLTVNTGVVGVTLGATGTGDMTFNGAVTLAATLPAKVSNTNTTFAGAVSGVGFGLTKSGTGTLILSNNTNSYSGATLISGGTLMVNGSITASSNIAISGGAQLRGTGFTSAVTTTTDPDAVWPGSALSGSLVPALGEKLTVTGLDYSANGGRLKIALNTSSTTSTQQLAVIGDVNLTNGTLSLGIPTNSPAGTLTILTYTGNLTGQFTHIIVNSGSDLGSNPSSPVSIDYSVPGAVNIKVVASAVTPIKIDRFTAKPQAAGIGLEWNCVSEFQNAGFNLFRQAVDSGDWKRINPALIAGRVTNTDEKIYSFYDWADAGEYRYKLESIAIDGSSETYPEFAGPVVADAYIAPNAVDAAGLDGLVSSLQNDASVTQAAAINVAFERAETGSRTPVIIRDLSVGISSGVDAVATARLTVAPQSSTLTPAVSSLVAARWFTTKAIGATSFTAAKVQYVAPGVLAIPQTSLPSGFDVKHVAIQREGRTLPILAVQNNTLYIYAPGYSDDYTATDALFVRSTAAPTVAGVLTQTSGLFVSRQPVNSNSPASVTTGFHDVYFDYNTSYRPYTFAPWFSNQYLTDGTDQVFSVTTPFACSGPAALTVTLWSLTGTNGATPDHALQVAINGQPAGQVASWSGGQKLMQLTFQVPSGTLKAGANQIDLVTPTLPGAASQVCFVHSLTMSYTRSLDGSQPVTLTNAGTSSQLFELNNVPSANVWIVDTRYPDRAAFVPYEAQEQADGTFRVRFNAAAGGTGQFLAVPFGQENAPTAVTKRMVKPISSTTYLATGPAAFSAGVQPVLMKHAREGLRGQFVDQEQLFDFYNYGRYGPAGIQSAVRSVRPQYLLLVGRTTYDYHNYSGANVDPLCPAFLVSTTFWAQATSDSMFGDLGRGYPEVAVGRLPVNNTTELMGAVQHILAYNGAPSSGIRVHAVADQVDPAAGNFPAQAAGVAQALPGLSWQANYLGVTHQTSADVTAAMTTAANGGADWLIYVGHGNAVGLGNESPRILDTHSVQGWTGNAVFLQSTCTGNWMAKDVQDYKSIAIQALTQPQGGISASIGTSTYMSTDYAVAFMTQLMKTAETAGAGKSMRWGDALMLTQKWESQQGQNYYDDLNRTEQLFSDPAMPVFQKISPVTGGANGATNSSASIPGHF